MTKIPNKIVIYFIITCILFSCTTNSKNDYYNGLLLEGENISNKAWTNFFESSNPETVYSNSFENYDEKVFIPSKKRLEILSLFITEDGIDIIPHITELIKNNSKDPYNIALLNYILDQNIYYNFKDYVNLVKVVEKAVKNKSTPLWVKQEYYTFLFDYYYYKTGNFVELDRIKSSMGLIEGWNIIGPFDNISGSGYNRDFVKLDETGMPILNNLSPGINNWEIKSFNPKKVSKDRFLNLTSHVSVNNNTSTYAYKNIKLNKDGLYQFNFSTQGSLEAWIDGRKIISKNSYYMNENGTIYREELLSGEHILVVKINNLDDNAKFSVTSNLITEDETLRSTIYNDLFTEDYELDYYLNALCSNLEDSNSYTEGWFWLYEALCRKGLYSVAEKLELKIYKNDNNSFTRWVKANYFYNIDEFYIYDKELMDLGENFNFIPAIKYVLKDYIIDKRYDILDRFIDINDNSKLDLIFNLAKLESYFKQDKHDSGFSLFKEIVIEYPNFSDPYLIIFDYTNSFSNETINSFFNYLYSHGNFYEFSLYRYYYAGSGSSKFTFLKNFLNNYIGNESMWVDYVNYSHNYYYENQFKNVERDILNSYPYSYELLKNNVNLKKAIFSNYKRKSDEKKAGYHVEDSPFIKVLKSLFLGSSIQKGSNGKVETDNYIAALKNIEKFYPYSIDDRDLLRELEDKDKFIDSIEFADSYSIINTYKNDHSIDYSESDAVIVLDEIKDIEFGDGASWISELKIIKVNKESAIEDNRYHNLEFNPEYGNGVLDEAFIIKPDGKRVYAERSGRRIAFSGLNSGDYIVLRYHVNSYFTGELNNNFWGSYYLGADYPIYKRSIQLITPRNSVINFKYNNISEKDVDFIKSDFLEDFTSYEFNINKCDSFNYELFGPTWRDILPWVDFTTVESWDQIISWYKNIYIGRTVPSYSLEQKVLELCKNAKNDEEKIRIIFDYVSANIEYEDLSFLYSNYTPQTADSVFKDGYGDCKDQSALLIAMLKIAGIDSYMVLNNPNYSGSNSFLPSSRFSHVFVCVKNGDETLYLDPTTTFYTYGELPMSFNGIYLLPINDNSSLIKFDLDGKDQKSEIEYVIDLSGDISEIRGNIKYKGAYAANLRNEFKGLKNDLQKSYFQMEQNIITNGFKLKDINFKNLEHLYFQPEVTFNGSISTLLVDSSNDQAVVNTPWVDALGNNINYLLSAATDSKSDLVISDLTVSTPLIQKIEITIPGNVTVNYIPDNEFFRFENSYIKYDYSSEGNHLFCTREVYIDKQTVPQSRLSDFRYFLESGIAKQYDNFNIQF